MGWSYRTGSRTRSQGVQGQVRYELAPPRPGRNCATSRNSSTGRPEALRRHRSTDNSYTTRWPELKCAVLPMAAISLGDYGTWVRASSNSDKAVARWEYKELSTNAAHSGLGQTFFVETNRRPSPGPGGDEA